MFKMDLILENSMAQIYLTSCLLRGDMVALPEHEGKFGFPSILDQDIHGDYLQRLASYLSILISSLMSSHCIRNQTVANKLPWIPPA